MFFAMGRSGDGPNNRWFHQKPSICWCMAKGGGRRTGAEVKCWMTMASGIVGVHDGIYLLFHFVGLASLWLCGLFSFSSTFRLERALDGQCVMEIWRLCGVCDVRVWNWARESAYVGLCWEKWSPKIFFYMNEHIRHLYLASHSHTHSTHARTATLHITHRLHEVYPKCK